MRPPTRKRRCTLLAGARVERGSIADWRALAPLHYRSHHAGAVTGVFRVVYDPGGEPSRELCSRASRAGARTLVGVLVVSRSALSVGARDRATGGRYRTAGMGRMATADLVNRELRVISRVVISPNWRGLGLASRLVAGALPEIGTPYVEAMAAMGRVHPFFERAGMTAYPQAPSAEGERLRACLEAVGIGRGDRRSADALGSALDALVRDAARLAWREIGRWARSYLGAKNHRTNRPDRHRMLDLAARHLDSAPVYYLWRREKMP
ncbi:MAG TPA: hypothetical protein VM238_08570 [Phycisphaerae bacterium]|nr:hypothetical protein [Phycisphaerae bacterium]